MATDQPVQSAPRSSAADLSLRVEHLTFLCTHVFRIRALLKATSFFLFLENIFCCVLACIALGGEKSRASHRSIDLTWCIFLYIFTSPTSFQWRCCTLICPHVAGGLGRPCVPRSTSVCSTPEQRSLEVCKARKREEALVSIAAFSAITNNVKLSN